MATYRIYGISNYNQSAYTTNYEYRYSAQNNYTLIKSGAGSFDSTVNIAGYSGFAIFIDNNMAINKILLGTSPLATDQNTVLIGGNLDMTLVENNGVFFDDIFRANDNLYLQDNNMQTGGTYTNGVIVGGTDVGATLIFTTRSASTLSVTINDLSRTGTSGAELLSGDTKNNYLSGLAGNDTLNGGAGTDTLVGGLGNDIYYVQQSSDVIRENSGEGTDTAYSYLSAKTLDTNVENGTIKLTGVAQLTGNALANILTGNIGANKLSGGVGSDVLRGGDGSDTLIGGSGRDIMTGGNGADIFDFNAASESSAGSTRDVIADFIRGNDKIDLTTIDANIGVTGNQAFVAPVVGGAFSGSFSSPARLYFDKVAHVLYGNIDSDAAAEFSIQLTGISALAATDFLL